MSEQVDLASLTLRGACAWEEGGSEGGGRSSIINVITICQIHALGGKYNRYGHHAD